MAIQKVRVRNHFKFTEAWSWLAVAIRAVTGEKWNHEGVRYTTPEGEMRFLHAIFPKSVDVNYDKWYAEKERGLEFVDIPDTPEARARIEEMKDQPYSVRNLFWYMPLFLTEEKLVGVANKHLGTKWVAKYRGWIARGTNEVDCSALAAYVAGKPDFYKAIPGRG